MTTVAYAGLPHTTMKYLADLTAQNNRVWFEANRPRYEAEWLGPGLDLAAALVPVCAAMRPRLTVEPKLGGSLRRLHRDLRFAKDKRPYEPWLHLILPTGPAINKTPGFHLVLTPLGISYGAGHYAFTPQTLQTCRQRICDPRHRAALQKALAAAQAAGSDLDPPDLARLPRGFHADPEWEHLLRRKTVIARAPRLLPVPDWIFTADCPHLLAKVISAHLPLLDWLLH